jgi:hypothetical protein
MRMRPDASLRPAKPPRGIILSTGEDVPRGQSLRARLMVVEVAPGDLKWASLTACRADAAAGRYAEALAGFVSWLAPQYAVVRDRLRDEAAKTRDLAHAEGMHARTPGIIADLAVGWHYWLEYALAVGAIDLETRDKLAVRVWKALLETGAGQAEHLSSAEPGGQFLRLVAAALASGRAHCAAKDGRRPADAEAWGWRCAEDGHWEPLGRRVGWIDGADLFLEPEAAYAEAQELARHQGNSLPTASRTLWRRLRERGLLASWDTTRQRNTVRRTLEGVRERDVLHLRAGALSACSTPSESSADAARNAKTGGMRTVRADGPVDGWPVGECEPSARTVPKAGENESRGQSGRSDTGAETAPEQKNGAAPHLPPGVRLFAQDRNGRPCSIADANLDAWTWEGAPTWYRAVTHPPPT